MTAELADGEWHRLHPATPLLRGGIAFIAILGIVISNLRERLIAIFVPGPAYDGDPIDLLIRRGLVPAALGVVAVVLLLFILGFSLSWRMHTFRITDELVEVRSGILFRTNRKGRVDRIQGINITRPLFARLFGAAKLELSLAGSDGNIQLSYLSGRNADALRLEILHLASGRRERDAASAAPPPPGWVAAGGVVGQRVSEFLAPERDPALAPPASVVTMHPGRLIGSTVLSTTSLIFAAFVIAGVVLASTSHLFFALFGLVPGVFGLGSFLVRRVTRSLRYSIAATPDGVRVGVGLLSTSNETLPPGRIHSVQLNQPLLWRAADWWEVRVNRAAHTSTRGQEGQLSTTILPVGTRAEAIKVVELLLPGLFDESTQSLLGAGLARKTPDDGYTTSPRRAVVLRWFSWRRNGFAVLPQAVLLRRGAIWRELVIVPTPRLQSVALHQGPLLRALRLGAVHVHTVHGPITARLGALDAGDASRFFAEVAGAAVEAARADRSHRWRSGETVGLSTAAPA